MNVTIYSITDAIYLTRRYETFFCVFLMIDGSMCNASSGSKMWRGFLINTRVSMTSDSTLLT